MIALMGIILFVVFLIMSGLRHMACGSDAQGWTSVMLLFLLIASFQTFAIAVSANMSGRSISRRRPARAISWKKKSASFRPCLRGKLCAIAQRQRRLREMGIRV